MMRKVIGLSESKPFSTLTPRSSTAVPLSRDFGGQASPGTGEGMYFPFALTQSLPGERVDW